MAGFLVVLCDTFADFRRGHAHNGIGRGIVVGVSSEDFNSERSFLHRIRLSGEGVPDNEPQEHGEATAVAEVWVLQQALYLLLDRCLFYIRKIGRIGRRRHIELHGGS